MNEERRKKKSIALDLTYDPAQLALYCGNVCHIFNNKNLRTGADLLTWITDILAENNLQISDVSEWTIGAGPGAFSQLRMLSAEIQGLTFRKTGVKCRALPSGMAFASIFNEREIIFNVVYQFMKNAITICSFEKKMFDCNLIGVSTVKSLEHCEFTMSDNVVICADNVKQYRNIPYLRVVGKYPVAALISINPDFWDRKSLTELIYGKPPAVKANR